MPTALAIWYDGDRNRAFEQALLDRLGHPQGPGYDPYTRDGSHVVYVGSGDPRIVAEIAKTHDQDCRIVSV